MNIFRLIGDVCHLMSKVLLLAHICKERSCGDLSGKSQILYLLVCLSRYLDVFTQYVSMYNTFGKVVYTILSGSAVWLMYMNFKETYQRSQDIFRLWLLLPIIFLIALIFNYELSFLEVFWAFSIYLEAVAMLPQMFMIYRIGKAERFTLTYMLLLAFYRTFYIFNWVYRYHYEGHYDGISHVGGSTQVIFNILFFTYYAVIRRPPPNDDLEEEILYRSRDEHVVLETPRNREQSEIAEVHQITSVKAYGTFEEKCDKL